ncbi:hypothetical protein FACS189413_18000 [Bacteroidia bacterium]|nr:hypothetical protein FACS189413_18000 [Bacteroidia bacterium]
MKKIFVFIFALFISGALAAQGVEFHLPSFAGQHYSIHLYKGSKNDTIQKGIIPVGGRLTFTLPEKDRAYAGMLHLGFEQGFQSCVLNGEDFSVTVSQSTTGANEIVFVNSVENNYLRAQFKELFTARQQSQAITGSSLYAARYLQLVAFMNGFSSPEDLIRYFTEELPVEDLYTSGLWNQVLLTASKLFADPKTFGEALINTLKRVHSQAAFNVLATALIATCEQFQWDDAEKTLLPYLVSSGKIENPRGALFYFMEMDKVKAGSRVIPLAGIDKDKLTNSLLVFYESGCSNCKTQLGELKKHYAELEKKGIRVITVSADTSEEVFHYHSKDFPWTDNLCDYQGFEGKDFRNYGVVATPTLFPINNEGMVTGRYAKLAETGLLD